MRSMGSPWKNRKILWRNRMRLFYPAVERLCSGMLGAFLLTVSTGGGRFPCKIDHALREVR